MFYAHFILKKRGPLSRIWLAAHWDKKVTKAQIFETDIEGSVEEILSPQLKIALRTSSHLLLGVVRIYSRKAKYLLADCNEAFVKIKLAFRPGMVDLPAENREASLTTINIREDFTSFDLDIIDFNEIDFHARFAVNQSRPEDITMREEVACMPFVGDDGFVDNDNLGGPFTSKAADRLLEKFRERNTCRSFDIIDCCEMIDELLLRKSNQEPALLRTPRKMMRNASSADSGFFSPSMWSPEVSNSFIWTGTTSRFLDMDCASSNCPSMFPVTAMTLIHMTSPTFKDAISSTPKTATMAGSYAMRKQGSGDFGFNPGVSTIPEVNLDDILFDQNADQAEVQPTELLREQENREREDEFDRIQVGITSEQREEEDDDDDGCNYDDACDDDDSLSDDFGGSTDHRLFSEENIQNQEGQLLYEESTAVVPPLTKTSESTNVMEVSGVFHEEPHKDFVHPAKSQAVIQDLTTLIENDAEAFALGPIEVNTKERKTKRKRRLIIDEHKVISSETMKGQLSDSSDLVMSLDLAPPTKRLMLWKETGGVDKLFVLPGKPIVNRKLFMLFSRNLITTRVSGDGPEIPDMTADVEEEVRPQDDSKIEVMRGEKVTDAEQDMSHILVMCDVDDSKNVSLDLPASPRPECSYLPVNDSTPNVNGDPATHHDEDILGSDLNFSLGLNQLPSLPVNVSTLSTDDDPDAREERSPLRKKRKQSDISEAPRVQPVKPLPQPSILSDFEEDLDNEDAIFDVELAPTCSERANLRQELEEAEQEEKLWNQRSTQMQHTLRRKLETSSVISFRQLTARNNRKQAASKFYTILVLTKARAIMVKQEEPFGDIQISRGPAFTGSM